MTASPSPLEYRFPADPARLRWLRERLRTELPRLGVTDDLASTIVLVVDEIVSNSIEHAMAYRSDGELTVRLEQDDGHVVLGFEDPDVPDQVVADLARALQTSGGHPPSPLAERGRGLFLVTTCMQDLVVDARSGGGLHLRGSFVQSPG